MSAIRVARGFTGRDVIVKFEGCYHGHADFLLVKAGSGARDVRRPRLGRRPGGHGARPRSRCRTTTRPRCARSSRRAATEIAAVIVEPVVGNMGVRAARAGLPRGDRRAVHEARRGLDLRRGDDRLPRRARRHAGALRPPARHDLPRQDRRRRHAARGVRRQARHHGEGRAARPRLPGGHAERKSGRRERGSRDARAPRRRALRAARGARRAPRERASSRASTKRGVDGVRAARRLDDHALLHGGPRAIVGRRGDVRHEALRLAGTADCSSAASTGRPSQFEAAFLAAPTPRPTSTRRSRPPTRSCSPTVTASR